MIVSLEAGDLVCFRPKGTRQRHAASVFDLFAYVVRCQALALARAYGWLEFLLKPAVEAPSPIAPVATVKTKPVKK